ncbi:hypothetical protein NQ315_014845 [Exocentrus adspersus]|uniref:Integrase zinc-binding domain-containing protein n=1 Tax=Exocentrus adspersus TaxID=1586481 RepID=A0AAV8VKQ1_9CUCU|nr:hypothetical protein NQ315_014845 [Exocentrus adspersus]
MEESLKQLMEMLSAVKASQEKMKVSQEEMKEDMKSSQQKLEEKLEDNREDMKRGQEELKQDMRRAQEDMKANQEELKQKLEDKLQEMKTTIEDSNTKLENKLKEFEEAVEEEITQVKEEVKAIEGELSHMKEDAKADKKEMNKKMEDLETKFRQLSTTGVIKTEGTVTTPSKVKVPTYDGKVSWNTYLRQFEAVVRNWREEDKATSLIAALRGEALEVLRTIPEASLNYAVLTSALERRYGDAHLQHVYQAQLRSRRQRFEETLQQYEADISRMFKCRRTKLDGPEEWGADTLAREQREDPDVGDIAQWKIEGKGRPAWQEISNRSPTFKGYWALWDSLAIENNLLKRVWESPDGKERNYQTILPRKRVPEVLQAVHSGVGGGHFGINKTLDKVRERFYWLGSRSDVEEWCRRCETCAASKGPRTRKLRLPIDLISDRPKKEEGVNNYICHLQDRLKLTHAEVRQKMRIESDRMKTRYDLRANTGGFQVGEKVWLYNPKRTKGKSPKLQKSWEPYTVVTRLNDVVYRIQKNSQAKMKIVHIDRLTPYQEPHPNEGVT